MKFLKIPLFKIVFHSSRSCFVNRYLEKINKTCVCVCARVLFLICCFVINKNKVGSIFII